MTELEDEIAQAEEDLDSTLQKMEETAQSFITATTEFIKDWYWKQAQGEVTSRHERTKALDTEQLANLKADVRTVQGNADTVVQEVLGRDDLWWHRKPAKQTYYRSGETRGPDHLDKALRLAAGRLATILRRYGYFGGDRAVFPEWNDTYTGEPSYPYMIDFSGEMLARLDEYQGLYQQAGTKKVTLNSLHVEKAQAEARKLWDEA